MQPPFPPRSPPNIAPHASSCSESLAAILPHTAAPPPAANVDSLVAELALLRQQVVALPWHAACNAHRARVQVLHLVKRQEVLETENHSLHSQLTAQVSPPRAQSASRWRVIYCASRARSPSVAHVTTVGRASTAMSSLANTMNAPVKSAVAAGETKFDNVKVIAGAELIPRDVISRRTTSQQQPIACFRMSFR